MKLTWLRSITSLCLCTFICGTSLEAFPKTLLNAPDFTEESVAGSTVSIHDYREKGIRVAPSYIREKLIIHNYGHGTASLALAWGSALEAFDYLELEILSDEFMFDFGEAAVLGAGVVGLTTANVLLDRGYKVTIYSDKFPPHITHDPIEGVWWPSGVSMGHNFLAKSAFKRMLKRSFSHFTDQADVEKREYAGVTKAPIYTFDVAKSHHNDAVEDLLSPGIQVAVTFDTGAVRRGNCYDTFHIDPSIYVHDLYEKALQKGAVLIQRNFKDQDELVALEENVIFNCTGKGSRYLFEDEELIPLRHQSVILYPQEGVDYLLRGQDSDSGRSMFLFPLHDRIVLGGVYQLDNPNDHIDLGQTARMLKHAEMLFQYP